MSGPIKGLVPHMSWNDKSHTCSFYNVYTELDMDEKTQVHGEQRQLDFLPVPSTWLSSSGLLYYINRQRLNHQKWTVRSVFGQKPTITLLNLPILIGRFPGDRRSNANHNLNIRRSFHFGGAPSGHNLTIGHCVTSRRFHAQITLALHHCSLQTSPFISTSPHL